MLALLCRKALCFILALAVPMLLLGCGGGSSSSSGSSSSGTIVISVADMKPILPLGAEEVLITFDEVSVHRSGGGWISLPLAQTPYTIDLLQFSDGTTTDLVPPTELLSAKYTQVRIGVIDASIVISGSSYPVEIPSENLKTDKEFDFVVVGGGAVDLTVDFDLSKSLVITGEDTYKLKPVLHINETQEAATIQGEILEASFGGFSEAMVIVTWDKDGSGDLSPEDEEYTTGVVEKVSDPTPFRIFWLVPGEGYHVQIDVDGTPIYEEFVSAVDLPPGAVFDLNGGNPI